MGTRRRRIALAALVGVAAAAGLAPSPRSLPSPAPAPAPAPVVTAGPAATDEALLRDRLGGLAGLVVGDDPRLRACADPGPVAPAAGPTGVDQIIAQVEAVRGLTLADPPEIQLLTDAEMTAQVTEVFGGPRDSPELDLDTRVLTTLGAIAPGTDLGRLRVEGFARQVSGFYQGGDGLIGIRTRDPPALSPLERVVLAHEIEHAMTDAHLGRPDARRQQTGDAALATAAVVEGSATATMLQYATAGLTPAERARLGDQLRSRAAEQRLAGYSPYLRAELQFPYVVGLRYTCDRWLAGGWEAVADAYRDPPRTTAAILFPERHGERPREPAPLGDPGGDWDHARTRTFGAAELEWLLAAPGGNPNAALDQLRRRVSAWDGGELVVWTDGAGTAVGLSLVDRGEGPPLCDTLRRWYAAAFPTAAMAGGTFTAGRQDAVLACEGDEVRLGIAPTTVDAAAITDRG
jgi:hypothetical protein